MVEEAEQIRLEDAKQRAQLSSLQKQEPKASIVVILDSLLVDVVVAAEAEAAAAGVAVVFVAKRTQTGRCGLQR